MNQEWNILSVDIRSMLPQKKKILINIARTICVLQEIKRNLTTSSKKKKSKNNPTLSLKPGDYHDYRNCLVRCQTVA